MRSQRQPRNRLAEPEELEEIDRATWLEELRDVWAQGEHVNLMGPTGSGKSDLAVDILDIRTYVTVFAFKKYDDTLYDFFRAGYKKITRWPPAYNQNRVVLWNKPKKLNDSSIQRERAIPALEDIFSRGGYTIFLDDTGFATSILKLQRETGVMLNQGRSSNISFVSAFTQPSSVIQRIPTETLRQARHIITFKYRNEDNIKAVARITGYNWRDIEYWMGQLDRYSDGKNRWTDFLAFSHDDAILVRNG
jgi:energy-coupling factor transporter ATP-binding protein EcfA2